MRKPNWAATVALVGFDAADLDSLTSALGREQGLLGADCKWKICPRTGVDATLATLERESVPVVLCNRDESPETWKQLLTRFAELNHPPLLIVASRHADERLWAEALNVGAHDVLAMPFHGPEVARTASLAYLRWQRLQPAAPVAAAQPQHMVA